MRSFLSFPPPKRKDSTNLFLVEKTRINIVLLWISLIFETLQQLHMYVHTCSKQTVESLIIVSHTLLYGYSLIIAKNFVTVYTAFDY